LQPQKPLEPVVCIPKSYEKYKNLKKKFSNSSRLKELFRAFDEKISRGKGHFSFRVFV